MLVLGGNGLYYTLETDIGGGPNAKRQTPSTQVARHVPDAEPRPARVERLVSQLETRPSPRAGRGSASGACRATWVLGVWRLLFGPPPMSISNV